MKEWILKIIAGLLLINALGTLALSQVHILAITKIFAPEIGFYLFFFIIFGLTTAFNAYLADKHTNILLYIFTSFLVIGAGLIYLNLMRGDVAGQENLTMSDEAIRNSWWLVIISLIIYGAGLIILPVLSWGNIKPAKI
jgi:hypothetical protein